MTQRTAGAGARLLLEMVRAQKRGEPRGIWSVCSANPFVLEASLEQARADGSALLVESTSNQVNPEGGYTGQTPADFARRSWPQPSGPGFPRIGSSSAATTSVRSRGRASRRRAPLRSPASWCGSACSPATRRSISTRAWPAPTIPAAREGRSTSGRSRSAPPTSAAVAEAAFSGARPGEAPVYVVGTEVPTPGGEQQDQPTRGHAGPRPPSGSSTSPARRSRRVVWTGPGRESSPSSCSPAWSSETRRSTPTIRAPRAPS